MQGYPKHVATKQDFLNLLSQDEFREQAIADLKKIYETKDDVVIQVVSGSEEEGDLVTKEIENPMPLWRIKGFSSREEIADIITQYGGKA